MRRHHGGNTNSTTKSIAEKQLWVRVIEQAIDDAMRSEHQKYPWQIEDVLHARQWLTEPNEDFTLVYDLADLQPYKVRAYAKEKIAQAVAKRLKASELETPGVGQNFAKTVGDQCPSTMREIEEIEFSQNSELPCL